MDKIIFQEGQPIDFQTVYIPFYEQLPAYNSPGKAEMECLFKAEVSRYEIVIFTDHETTQLVGMIPREGKESIFGFWETRDEETNSKAFEALESYTLSRGCTKLTGPVNFNTFHRYRLKLNDPSWGYFTNEPVNPLCYPQLLQKMGYEKDVEYESRKIEGRAIEMVYKMRSNYIATIKDLPYNILNITHELWQQRLSEIYHLVDAIFRKNPFYRPLSFEQFKQMFGNEFVSKLCPYCSCFFEDPETGKLVAMSFTYPDYSPLGIRDRYVFARDFPKLKDPCLLIKSIGVLPQYRNKRLMTYLAAHGMQNFPEHYRTAMFCLMRSDNISLRFTDSLPFEKAEYALFSKNL